MRHHPRPRRVTVFLLLVFFFQVCVFLSGVPVPVSASSNGCLWNCEEPVPAAGDNSGQCVFVAQTQEDVTACQSGLTAISNVVTSGAVPSGCIPGAADSAAVGKCDLRRASSASAGTCGSAVLAPSPLPLTNGDCAVIVDAALTGTQLAWSTAMVYGLLLREKVMFRPYELTNSSDFDKWTRPLTDCAIKVGPAASGVRRHLAGGTSNINTAAVQEIIANGLCNETCASTSSTCGGNGPSASNLLLQWMEEGLADLACLIDPSLTINDPDRCAAARARLDVPSDSVPDCWVHGWEAIFGVSAPVSGMDPSDEYADGVGPSTCSAGDGIDASTGIDAAHAENPFFALMMWLGVVLLRTIVTEFL